MLNKIKHNNVIFDLDGTLIDSAPGILNSIEKALNKHKKKVNLPLQNTLIGPPLKTTFQHILNTQNTEIIDPIIKTFSLYYDTVGYKNCNLYPGILQILKTLKQNKHNIFIVTNKRLNPTQKILKRLKIENFFIKIYTPDMLPPLTFTKKELLGMLILDFKINVKEAVYVGDRHEDSCAAKDNNIQFVLADWGYVN